MTNYLDIFKTILDITLQVKEIAPLTTLAYNALKDAKDARVLDLKESENLKKLIKDADKLCNNKEYKQAIQKYDLALQKAIYSRLPYLEAKISELKSVAYHNEAVELNNKACKIKKITAKKFKLCLESSEYFRYAAGITKDHEFQSHCSDQIREMLEKLKSMKNELAKELFFPKNKDLEDISLMINHQKVQSGQIASEDQLSAIRMMHHQKWQKLRGNQRCKKFESSCGNSDASYVVGE